MRKDDISVKIKTSIKISNPEHELAGFGYGVVRLCELVDSLGSLNRAASEMDMSYSKAWRLVKSTEEHLGITLFVRKGAHGSCLTDEAKSLIGLYRRVDREANIRANEVLREALDEMGGVEVFVGSHTDNTSGIEIKATPELIAQVRALRF